MEPTVSLSPDVPGSDSKRSSKLPLQYFYVKVRQRSLPSLNRIYSLMNKIDGEVGILASVRGRFSEMKFSNNFYSYLYEQQVIGMKNNKPVFLNKVLAVYPKGLKVVHATTGARTVKELEFSNLIKFVDIREFQYLPDKSIFRFFYRNSDSNDPLPLSTDLQFEFELALVSELNQTIDAALNHLASKRKRSKRQRSQSLATTPSPPLIKVDTAVSQSSTEFGTMEPAQLA